MAHTVLWPKKKFFYPIGNTPPVSFTQNLAPEMAADILLLGCGDPRSILYTIYAGPGTAQRKLDFTCCDAEPAILARNVLLFTMILEDDSVEGIGQAWNIFFHFYLDKNSLECLRRQSRKLAGLSSTIESWKKSKYSKVLRFCSTHTLSELHRHWKLYDEMDNLQDREKRELQDLFQKGMAAVRNKLGGPITTASRSAGPLWAHVAHPGSIHFERFWNTGVTFDDVAHATLINPTFAYDASGRGFNVHYGTDPIIAFHLSPCANHSSLKNSTLSASDLVQIAKQQFRSWCTAFKARITGPHQPIIRLFVGDALAFARTLHACSQGNSVNSGLYISPWGCTQVNLDGGDYIMPSDRAPMSFHLIDTSNLTDHLGLVNVLIVALPLLQTSPVAVLYTNIILNPGGINGSPDGLAHRLCADVTTLSLLLGIVPVSYVSEFTSHHNTHGTLTTATDHTTRLETISWKRTPFHESLSNGGLQPQLQVDSKILGSILFNTYLKMFSDENITELVTQLQKGRPGNYHYLRASFAALLSVVKRNTRSDWTQTVNHLLGLIEADRTLLVGLNFYQDLCCQLHIYGVHTVPLLMGARVGAGGVFQGWSSTPSVVCVSLKVPRTSIKILEAINVDRIGTPILQCEIEGPNFHNIFPSIQSFFGDIIHSPGCLHSASMTEDTRQWTGGSDLIVTFFAPSWILCQQATATKIHLGVRADQRCIPYLYLKLGFNLRIFSACLTDRRHVQVTHERPGNPQKLGKHSVPLRKTSATSTASVSMLVNEDTHISRKLCARVVICDLDAQAALRTCPKNKIKIKQVSPFSMLVSFGLFDRFLSYPYPIDGTNFKSRIARASSYIEVDVDLCIPHSRGMVINPFPLVMHKSIPVAWNIHSLSLDRSPKLDMTKREWLGSHLSLCLSDAEGHIPQQQKSQITSVKHMIRHMLVTTSPFRPVAVHDPVNKRTIFFFVNCLRLDLSSQTVVADACAITLPTANSSFPHVEVIRESLLKISDNIYETRADSAEELMTVWWQLLPILSERCREWSHTNDCEYRSRDIPDIPDMDKSPFCSCGLGKFLPQWFLASQWKHLAPFSTRIGLGPLFPLTYPKTVESGPPRQLSDMVGDLNIQPDMCDACGSLGKPRLMRCSVCSEAKYCSKLCQKEDWKAHKVCCRKIEKDKEA